MNKAFIFLLMIFCHIVDDYYLQGWLASAKQKKYWKDNAPNQLYKYDYVWALIMHSFSWTFMVMLPIAYLMNFNITILFAIAFLLNILTHAFVDNLKANKQKLNLIQDQSIHLLQIILTFAILL